MKNNAVKLNGTLLVAAFLADYTPYDLTVSAQLHKLEKEVNDAKREAASVKIIATTALKLALDNQKK